MILLVVFGIVAVSVGLRLWLRWSDARKEAPHAYSRSVGYRSSSGYSRRDPGLDVATMVLLTTDFSSSNPDGSDCGSSGGDSGCSE